MGDYIGRRRLACFGALLCAMGNFFLAALAGGRLAAPSVASFLLFIFSWNLGFGGLQLLVVSELLPTELRGLGAGMVYAVTGALEVALNQTFELALLSNAAVTMLALG